MEEEGVEYRQMGIMEELTGVKQPYNAGSNVVPFKRVVIEKSEPQVENSPVLAGPGHFAYGAQSRFATGISDPDFREAVALFECWERIGRPREETMDLIFGGLGNEIHNYPIEVSKIPSRVSAPHPEEVVVSGDRFISYRVGAAEESKQLMGGPAQSLNTQALVAAEKPVTLVNNLREGERVVYIEAFLKKEVNVLTQPAQVMEITAAVPNGNLNNEEERAETDFLGRDLSQFLPIKKAA